jgi:proteasome lid subunit RPN8/RPN11
MVMSASESFPKECMGCVCVNRGGSRVVSAFPYQYAKRYNQSVTSSSSGVFDRMLREGPLRKLGDYHSHTFFGGEKAEELEPSPTDLDMPVGGMEAIVSVRRTNRMSFSIRSSGGRIYGAWRNFRFRIAVFRRTKKSYDLVALRLRG